MNKNTKMLIGIGAVAVVAYLIWKNQTATTSFVGNSVGNRNYFLNAGGRTETAVTCPRGQVLCPNNRRKCYDPNVNYLVDPCSKSTF